MTFPSFCEVHTDTAKCHLRTLEEDILRRRIASERRADVERIYAEVARTCGISNRKPDLDELDRRGRPKRARL